MVDSLSFAFQTLLDLWHDIRKFKTPAGETVAVPTRAAFDPMSLGKLLPHVHLLEFHGTDRLVFRLSGTAEVRRLGEDPKGQDYFALIDMASAGYLRRHMHRILFYPAGVLVDTRETYPDGSHIPTRFLALPLRDAAAGRDYVIAMVEVSGRTTLGTAPFFDQQQETTWSDRIIGIQGYDLGCGIPKVQPYIPDPASL